MGAPGPTALSRLQSLRLGAGETDDECSGAAPYDTLPHGQQAAPASAERGERGERQRGLRWLFDGLGGLPRWHGHRLSPSRPRAGHHRGAWHTGRAEPDEAGPRASGFVHRLPARPPWLWADRAAGPSLQPRYGMRGPQRPGPGHRRSQHLRAEPGGHYRLAGSSRPARHPQAALYEPPLGQGLLEVSGHAAEPPGAQ